MALFGFFIAMCGLLVLKEPKRIKFEPIEGDASKSEDSQKNILENFVDSFKQTIKNPITRYCIMGSMSKYIVFYSIAYFLPAFLL